MSVTIESVQSAFPPRQFTQTEIGELLGIENPVVHRLLEAPHIQHRHLQLDDKAQVGSGPMPREQLSQLHKRFKAGIEGMGYDAVRGALKQADTDASSLRVVVTVTSSGLALPGISAMLIKDLGVNRKAHRADIVGMGCNAGMSGLRTLSQMLAAHPPGSQGLLLCCEVNSALHIRDNTVGTGIVNSLFGDGSVAVVVKSADADLTDLMSASSLPLSSADSIESSTCPSPWPESPIHHPGLQPQLQHQERSLLMAPKLRLVDFESHCFPELFDDMRYGVDDEQQLYNFKLSKRIPDAVATAASEPVRDLMERHNVTPQDVKHWIVHSGGAAVIAGVTKHLGLPEDALRHTVSVLRDYGNLSSGSFLVSYERLLEEHIKSEGKIIASGEPAVVMAMGPGATIEVGFGYF